MNRPTKSRQSRPRPTLSKNEIIQQITALLDSPDDDLQAAMTKELLAGLLKLHDSHLDLLDLKIVRFPLNNSKEML